MRTTAPSRTTLDTPRAASAVPARAGRRASWWIAVPAGLVGAAIAALASPDRTGDAVRASPAARHPYRDLALFGVALREVRRRADAARGDGDLVDAAITGMIASLDRHARYLTAAQVRMLDDQDAGRSGGLGVEVEASGRVRSTLPDGPAARAGLVPGTVIERVEDVAVADIGPVRLADRLRGAPGSAVHLRVVRPGAPAPVERVLVRVRLALHPVRLRLLGTVAYLGIDYFDALTSGGLLEAIATLKAGLDGSKLAGVVLDLRGNPGGLIGQAVAVAGAFLGRGEIVRLLGRSADAVERFASAGAGGDRIDGVPMVVLVDGGTASAAEIVAAALQDHRRATLIGTRTYGKGAVQTTFALRDGRGLRLTTAWAVTPAGRRLEGAGIEPDRWVATGRGAGPRTDGEPRGRAAPGSGSLREGPVVDADIDPGLDPPLREALAHLGTVAAVR
ncbi:S41 family peptidase [Methylobacterium sp. C33D]